MQIHIVQQYETLGQVASIYGVNSSDIIQANGLSEQNLAVGSALIIPSASLYYTIKSGDTLWKIAQKSDTTVSALIRTNNITNSNLIYPGMILSIPATVHTVKSGETLWQIARSYDVTIQSIVNANKIINPNLINSGTVLIIPKPKPTIEVNAYTYHAGNAVVQAIKNYAQHLTYFSPFAYGVQEDGGLVPFNDDQLVQTALSAEILPMMAISNFTSQTLGSNIAHAILSDSGIQNTLLSNVVNVMKRKSYRVLNIDFENVLPADRDLYSSFVQRAINRLHPEGFSVSTALAPKTSSNQKGTLYEAHDYAAHGRIADFVVLMTYEWGYRLGPPQAISPLNQIRRVLDYAVSVIPRNKIMMGFQTYARDWLIPHVQGQTAETFSPQIAIGRAIRYGAAIQYDSSTESPFFNYTDEQGQKHQVWFEDARSAQAKFNLVKEYKLRGISYWILDTPFPQNWILLNDNFSIGKKA